MKNATTIDSTRWTPRVPDLPWLGREPRWRSATGLMLVMSCAAGCASPGDEPESPPLASENVIARPAEHAAGSPVELPTGTEADSPMSPSSVPQSTLDAALDDAATRTSIDRAKITVVSAASVTWSDGSAGCPEPGMMYTQALVPGYRIVLRAGDQVLNYHAGRSGSPRYCPADRVVPPSSAGNEAI